MRSLLIDIDDRVDLLVHQDGDGVEMPRVESESGLEEGK